MAVYNLTNITNSSNIVEFAQGTNAILGGYFFGYFVLLIIFFVTFVSLKAKGYHPATCVAVACWLNMLIALLLRPMELLDNYVFWGMILLCAGSTFILFLSANAD